MPLAMELTLLRANPYVQAVQYSSVVHCVVLRCSYSVCTQSRVLVSSLRVSAEVSSTAYVGQREQCGILGSLPAGL